MLAFLPPSLKASLSTLLVVINTTFWCLLLYVFALIKLLIPLPAVRRLCSHAMVLIAESWIACNSFNIAMTQSIHWDVEGLENLRRGGSYLVCCNHQTWSDIVVLQHVLNRRIPFLRFFLKRQLIYVPLLGLAWWALDFPFMYRLSKSELARHPERRGQDLLATQKACERFRGQPIAILNFLEGTRFTAAKHARQKSPYQNLLHPKAGGLAFVLGSMGDQFTSLLDVTIVYPRGAVTLWQLLRGEVQVIQVRVREIQIPADLLSGSYSEDPQFRVQLQAWVRSLWENKDYLITQLRTDSSVLSQDTRRV